MQITRKNKRFFKAAEAIADTSEFPKIHIGAVVVVKNEIISVGTNLRKTHPMQKRYNINRFNEVEEVTNHYIHAEINALLKVKHLKLKDASIYVYRKNSNNKFAMCRPCNACMAYIKELGIRSIYYTSCYERVIL